MAGDGEWFYPCSGYQWRAANQEDLMNITVDRLACVGAGQCALVAGELFDQDDDGIVDLLEPSPEPGQFVVARRAASLCPARAITVTESE
jgi:ferredoxin